jgi:hypothetical protein
VPKTSAEHDKIIDRLITGGFLLGEAEHLNHLEKSLSIKLSKNSKSPPLNPILAKKRGQRGHKINPNQIKHANSTSDEYAS